ncbi:MAG: hypothetical protein KGN36_10085 [Acidobacteriota bacterium]|nr:hypothetical protein [Acidobacteriota bacterium]
MHIRRFAVAALTCCLVVTAAAAQKKKKEVTQTLQLPADLPAATTGETRHLAFHVTPLSAKGLLSQQVRDALRALFRETGHDPVLHLRAFVAGSGDLRRVRDLVSDTFTDRKQSLPALSLIQAGGLPLEGAQIVLEAVSAEKREGNPQGLIYLPAPVFTAENPLEPAAPLAARSLAQLQANLAAAGGNPASVLRVTCFLSTLEGIDATRQAVAAAFPGAAADFVQTQRAPVRATGACEAVARLTRAAAGPLEFVPAQGEPKAALISAAQVVLSGTQASFGYQEADSRLAFDRLLKSLEAAGVSRAGIALAQYYSLADPISAQIRRIAPAVFGNPASSILLFEGLPSMDTGFAADVVAVKSNPR